uniref:Integrin beta n=2 Tax=Erpetoichthys calabaricus TaxID=27687 RepID=A0A8C4SHJ5_ERPCA
MIFWQRRHHPFAVRMLCAVGILSVSGASDETGDSRCTSSEITNCRDCIYQGPECGWCFAEDFLPGTAIHQRCDLTSNLIQKGCKSQFIESPQVKKVVNSDAGGTQVTPKEILLHLRPGSEASFILEVHQLEKNPIDLYYLVDVSVSMQENLAELKSVGLKLSQRMEEFTEDIQMGFGSFVDKPVSPYISVYPPKLINPCIDYTSSCSPAHGFIHALSLTKNITDFTRVVQQQHISGNMDTPEGGLDAMLQAAVCQRQIGWRKEAKHLLLVMTDEPSHLALDSKLAGIVIPHDGSCHLKNNTYAGSTKMEYPTIGQLAEKLLENNIYCIFAVGDKWYKWYEDLTPLLPGTVVGKLYKQATNLKELVVDAYKNLISEVEILVEGPTRGFIINITAKCPDGTEYQGLSKCRNVKPNQKVLFNVTVKMNDCPLEEGDIQVLIKPVGFNETTKVKIISTCKCHCRTSEEKEPGRCQDENTEKCENCQCNTPDSDLCTCERPTDKLLKNCKAVDTQPVCSSRGTCSCGICLCDQSNLGIIFGKHCEMDNFSCPYNKGILCAGHGQCVLGECKCNTGWEGENCNCTASQESCLTSQGEICSGRGKCICGKCQCDDPRSSGHLCQICPTCDSACETNWQCVQCHLSNEFSDNKTTHCNTTCSPLVHYVSHHSASRGESKTSAYCLYPTEGNCHYKFQMEAQFGIRQLHIYKHPECLSEQRYFPTFIVVFLVTLLFGLIFVVTLRCIIIRESNLKNNSPAVVHI